MPAASELGINVDHIWRKTKAVLMPTQTLPHDILEDRDFAGPLVICMLLGFSLLLVRCTLVAGRPAYLPAHLLVHCVVCVGKPTWQAARLVQ